MISYTNFFYRNPRLMLLAICLIVVSGLSSFFILPRMEDPALVSRGAFVNTIFPGAEPSRVEALVSEKIEDALSEIYEIKEVRSTSRESISAIAIELRDEVKQSDPVWSKIRDRNSSKPPRLPPVADVSRGVSPTDPWYDTVKRVRSNSLPPTVSWRALPAVTSD